MNTARKDHGSCVSWLRAMIGGNIIKSIHVHLRIIMSLEDPKHTEPKTSSNELGLNDLPHHCNLHRKGTTCTPLLTGSRVPLIPPFCILCNLPFCFALLKGLSFLLLLQFLLSLEIITTNALESVLPENSTLSYVAKCHNNLAHKFHDFYSTFDIFDLAFTVGDLASSSSSRSNSLCRASRFCSR